MLRLLSRAGLVLVACALVAATAAAAPEWARHYDRGERLLRAGDAAGAEAEFLRALGIEPRSACQARTHGMVHVTYVPWFRLGLARVRQGRLAEAREAFDRAAAEGVVTSCAATRREALDLAEFLEDLSRVEVPAPDAPGATGADGRPRLVAELRGAAEDATTTVRIALEEGRVADDAAERSAAEALAEAEGLLERGGGFGPSLDASLAAQRALATIGGALPEGGAEHGDWDASASATVPPGEQDAPADRGASTAAGPGEAAAAPAAVTAAPAFPAIDLAWSPSLPPGAPRAILRPTLR